MFELRSVFVSLGFFGVLYCFLSLLVAATWRFLRRMPRLSATAHARLLYWLRISPLVGSILVTLVFALPAFVVLEGPPDEDAGTYAFGVCALLLVFAGMLRVMTTRARTRRVEADWMQGATALEIDVPLRAYETMAAAPPLLLFGVVTPTVLVSRAAVGMLSREELQASVRHEAEHMRSRDNLKKLLIHTCSFPGMGSLDRAWQVAAELAADDAAVSSRGQAVDLAAALIKLSSLTPELPPAFTTGLVSAAPSISSRVERLLAWGENRGHGLQVRPWHALPFALITLSYAVVDYNQALLWTHRLTERFVH
jgi:Zn-dependent protease with chaperone function